MQINMITGIPSQQQGQQFYMITPSAITVDNISGAPAVVDVLAVVDVRAVVDVLTVVDVEGPRVPQI
jgi:hypothetical protein